MKKAKREPILNALKNAFTITLIVRNNCDEEAVSQSFDARSNSAAYDARIKASEIANNGGRCLMLLPQKMAEENAFGDPDGMENFIPLTLSQRGGVQRAMGIFIVEKGKHDEAVMSFAFGAEDWNKPLNRILAENAHTCLATEEQVAALKFAMKVELAAQKFRRSYNVRRGERVWLEVPVDDDAVMDEDPMSPGYGTVKSGGYTQVPYTF